MDAYLLRMPSPIGRLELLSDGSAVTSLTIERDGTLPRDHLPERPNDVLETARDQLDEYFAGERRTFDVPLAPDGTPFREPCGTGFARSGGASTSRTASSAWRWARRRPVAPSVEQ